MKISQIVMATCVLLLASACGHEYLDQQADQPEEQEAHMRWPELPLVAIGPEVYLRIPDSLREAVELHWNDNFGRLEVTAGPHVDMFIMQTNEDVEYKKFELERGIFEVTYLEEEADRIIYKASLPDGSSAYYHFYTNFSLGEQRYQVENNPLVEFNEEAVALMSLIAGTIIDKSLR